jgi:4-hydroxy-3-polyprenylbenzoate decarboxylase
MNVKHLVIGISGASGAIYGITLLDVIKKHCKDIITHLIITKAAHITVTYETEYSVKQVMEKADHIYHYNDIAARIASGSFVSIGMIVAPCSIKTLAEIATGNTNNLLSRVADVNLKERRKLVLMLRETPLHQTHIQNMLSVTQMGGIIAPTVNAFYIKPQTIQQLVEYTVIRTLDLFQIYIENNSRWSGI